MIKTCDDQLLIIEHKKLQTQLKSSIYWIKNYISLLSMTLVNKDVFIKTEIPEFVYQLAINMLCENKNNYKAENFRYIECGRCKKKTFEKIAFYCYDRQKQQLSPCDILPLHTTFNLECITQEIIKEKIAKLEGFVKLFEEIINISEIYMKKICNK
jgi:hypothetical protein